MESDSSDDIDDDTVNMTMSRLRQSLHGNVLSLNTCMTNTRNISETEFESGRTRQYNAKFAKNKNDVSKSVEKRLLKSCLPVERTRTTHVEGISGSALFVIDRDAAATKVASNTVTPTCTETPEDVCEEPAVAVNTDRSVSNVKHHLVKDFDNVCDDSLAQKSLLYSSVQSKKSKTKLHTTNNNNIRPDKTAPVQISMAADDKAMQELLKTSVLMQPGAQKMQCLPPYQERRRQMQKQRRLEREKTKGKNWYDMVAPEMTEEKKNDLLVLQMRQSLDPKHFYKGPDLKGALPKFFQVGTVVETSAEFYNSRIPKKQRKRTLVDELLDDADYRQYNKRKYAELQQSRQRGHGAYKHMKRLKKSKK